MRHAALPLLFISLLAPALAHASTLSVCTEASPDGFDVVQYNALTTTNASADVLMNRLVRVAPLVARLPFDRPGIDHPDWAALIVVARLNPSPGRSRRRPGTPRRRTVRRFARA